MDEVIRNQNDNLKLFEQMANEATNPDLRNYGRQTIPFLREYLGTAQEIRSRI